MKTEARVAEIGEKIIVTGFSCAGFGKKEFEVGSIWTVSGVSDPFGVTFCEGSNGFIVNDKYAVIVE